ncbi:MAG: cell wall hydrolase [Oscillospiraceae bacterium]|nr:cell wall hydrolase [Oscillospiraceae bacterium]
METAQSVTNTGEIVIKSTENVIKDAENATETEETEAADQSLIGSLDWGAEDSEILLKIAMAEAEGEDTEGKALVMLVVLNRVWSDDFPDSIEAVVFQENQFSPVKDGGRYYTTEPDEDCYAALALIQGGWDQSMGALYFESEENADNWHSNNLTYLFQHGNHRFYK